MIELIREHSRLGVTFILLLASLSASAQVNVGINLGGNLSNADGVSFRSSRRLGFQAGGTLTIGFHKHMAIQAEPSFNLTRIRANDETSNREDGIQKGNKSLQFFNLPVLFKLKITPAFALLSGIEFNKLINDQQYRLNNDEPAFKSGNRLGYSLGAELGKFYFRYRGVSKSTRVGGNWNAVIEQYQFGIRWILI
ncbi:outer membrane beta-barrel protein [Sphingobacterium sp. LRF_L2]|uniref:outer membrane beta-barrel protein n=1 Tax=Sphingobacterium sp. LRF_L2 TaxID=3369421 RepID=UPI003F5D9AB7